MSTTATIPPRRTRRSLGVRVALALALTCGALGTSSAFDAPPASASVVYTGAGETWSFGVIGDSAWSGIRWLGTWGPLRRFNYRADLESCRRTLVPSCRGREGYAPTTTVTAMRTQAGTWGAVLVIATGYNDPGPAFASGVDAVMAEASRQQIYRVVWMTMRTANVSYRSPVYSTNNVTFRQNNSILRQKAAEYGGRLVIADWDSYSGGHPEWFTADGIHLRPAGGQAAAQFIADSVAQVLAGVGQPASTPTAPQTWVDVSPGDRGTRVVIVQQYLERAGVSILGGIDGVYGGNTTAAVMEFQQRIGLPVTGVVDKPTAVELSLWFRDASTPKPSAPSDWVDVVPGDRGMRVAVVQHYLRGAGVPVGGDTDGVYRSATMNAVRAFQSARRLPITGIVDKATAVALGLWPRGGPPRPGPSGNTGWVNVLPGDSGMRVAIVQKYLRDAGVAVLGDYDGVYREATIDAVRLFQARRRLSISGIVDLPTAVELRLWARPASPSPTASAAIQMAVAPAAQPLLAQAPGPDVATSGPPDVHASQSASTEPEPPDGPRTGSLGDLVWEDLDGDGVQGSDEGGVLDVEVRLLDEDGGVASVVFTDAEGAYGFTGLEVGEHRIEMVVPTGYALTLPDRGVGADSDEVDSDAQPTDIVRGEQETTVRVLVRVNADAADSTFDVGLVHTTVDVGSTTTTTTSTANTSTTTTSSTTTTTTSSTTTTTMSTTPTATTQAPAEFGTSEPSTTSAESAPAPSTAPASEPATTVVSSAPR